MADQFIYVTNYDDAKIMFEHGYTMLVANESAGLYIFKNNRNEAPPIKKESFLYSNILTF